MPRSQDPLNGIEHVVRALAAGIKLLEHDYVGLLVLDDLKYFLLGRDIVLRAVTLKIMYVIVHYSHRLVRFPGFLEREPQADVPVQHPPSDSDTNNGKQHPQLFADEPVSDKESVTQEQERVGQSKKRNGPEFSGVGYRRKVTYKQA